jgi:predicted enzyme related to lactoylglutathione lyase
MIGQVVYAKNPERMAAFYSSLFEMERREVDGGSFTLVRAGMEIHVVKVPADVASAITLSTPPIPRETTPLKFSIEVPSIDRTAATAQTLGGVPRGEPWNWNSRRHLDIIDVEGNIFQVFERKNQESSN